MTQEEYITLLFNECGYDTASQRKAWIKKRYDREYPDELDSREKGLVIQELKNEKFHKDPRQIYKDEL